MNNAGMADNPGRSWGGGRVRVGTMRSYRRVGRWALLAVLIIMGGWLALRYGVTAYLRTEGGRAVVAGQLRKAIGLPVEVSSVDVGSRSSSLAFRVLEPDDGPSPKAEVLSVESAEADVSLLDILT